MPNHELTGVIPAIATPMDKNGEPDGQRFVAHGRWLLANGSDALNVLGTTGEANSLSQEQRMTVMEAASEALPHEKMMVGTGVADFETTVALTGSAKDMGFPIALVLPPFYYKNTTDEGLYTYFARLIEKLGARCPIIYLYNFPQMTGLVFSFSLIARLRKDFPQVVCGIKDSSGDMEYALKIVEQEKGFVVLPSSETVLKHAKADGFSGCISATVNISSPLAQKIWQGLNVTESDHLKLELARRLLTSVPPVPAIKYMLSLRYKDESWENPFLPQIPLNQDQKQKLSEIMDMV